MKYNNLWIGSIFPAVTYNFGCIGEDSVCVSFSIEGANPTDLFNMLPNHLCDRVKTNFSESP